MMSQYLSELFVYAHEELYASIDARRRVKVESPPRLFCFYSKGRRHDVAERSTWTEVLEQAHRQLCQSWIVHVLAKHILNSAVEDKIGFRVLCMRTNVCKKIKLVECSVNIKECFI